MDINIAVVSLVVISVLQLPQPAGGERVARAAKKILDSSIKPKFSNLLSKVHIVIIKLILVTLDR